MHVRLYHSLLSSILSFHVFFLKAYKNSVSFHSGQRNTSDKESLDLEMLQVLDDLYANQSIAYKKGKVNVEP